MHLIYLSVINTCWPLREITAETSCQISLRKCIHVLLLIESTSTLALLVDWFIIHYKSQVCSTVRPEYVRTSSSSSPVAAAAVAIASDRPKLVLLSSLSNDEFFFSRPRQKVVSFQWTHRVDSPRNFDDTIIFARVSGSNRSIYPSQFSGEVIVIPFLKLRRKSAQIRGHLIYCFMKMLIKKVTSHYLYTLK